jgi:predicted GTPase
LRIAAAHDSCQFRIADSNVQGVQGSVRMRSVVIMGAAGRDFHDFNVVFRDDPSTRVVAFTAAQIPGIENRLYPPSLAGARYPQGIPIRPESDLANILRNNDVSDVILAYSDLSNEDVMHKASLVLAAGANFRLLGPQATMLPSSRPVIAVGAVRTGSGKSQTSRAIGKLLLNAGLRVALVRHPMPYGDLAAMKMQRFATLADIDAARPTLEEREEYEAPVRLGLVVFAGVDYAAILSEAEREADVIVWDGGNNDFPFFRPDLFIVVTDPLRAGHELAYYPGEVCLRMADVVIVNKIDSAKRDEVERVLGNIADLNPKAPIVRAESPVTLDSGPDLAGKRVLAVEDGPTLTHGGMAFGAATVAARNAGAAVLVDPRPFAAGSIAQTFARYPHLGRALPAMGYSDEQLAELAATIEHTPCDVVVTGTPVDLARIIPIRQPVRHARYELREIGQPTIREVIAPIVQLAHEKSASVRRERKER